MNKSLRLLLAIGISILGLYLAFRGVHLDDLLANLMQVDVPLVLAAMLLMVFSVWIRALRWQIILNPVQRIGVHALFGSTMIGYFGNSVLPFRLGEVLRAYSVSRATGIKTSLAFGTIVLERVLDMIGVLVLMVFFLVLYPFPVWLKLSGLIAGVGTGVVVILILIIARSHKEWLEAMGHWKLFRGHLGARVLKLIANLVGGLLTLKGSRHGGAIIFQTGCMWLVYYACTYLVVMAVHLPVTWIAVGITLVASTLAITIPAAPGYIGTYHATAVFVMVELFAVAKADAQAFAVLVHAIGFLPYALVGFFYFLASSVRLSDVRRNGLVESPDEDL